VNLSSCYPGICTESALRQPQLRPKF